MNKTFLKILACPICKRQLTMTGILSLRCNRCRKTYQIREGIPILIDLKNLPDHLSGQIRYFESAAKHYSAVHTLASWEKHYVDRLTTHIGSFKGKMIVDNACGSGYMAFEAAKRGAFVLACDLNLSGLVHLKKIAKAIGVADRMLFVCCTSEALPLASSSADALIANAILEHLPKERESITDISRVAKKNAVAMITVPLAYHLLNPLFYMVNYIHDRQIGHLRRYTKEMLVERFLGWKILEVNYSGHTRKVIKTLLNIIWPIFNEKQIEIEDKRYASDKFFASNISMIFRKKL